MSAAIPLLAATTAAAATISLNANEYDEVTICTNTNALGNGENVTVSLVNSTGNTTPVYFDSNNSPILQTSTPAQAQLQGTTGAVILSVTLRGGCVYNLNKSATAAAVGIDFQGKPRIGNY